MNSTGTFFVFENVNNNTYHQVKKLVFFDKTKQNKAATNTIITRHAAVVENNACTY